MKRSIFLLLILCVILLFQFAFAQKDPFDPGQADTLYFSAGGQHSADGDTLYLPPGSIGGDVTILINFWNDYGIRGFTIPLSDTCSPNISKIQLDSLKNNGSTSPICFQGSRVEDFNFKYVNLSLYPDSNKVLYGASSFEDSVDPGNGIFAAMIYTVTDTTTICLDTANHFPPENVLRFVTPLSAGYRPIFVPRSFHVGVRSNEPPTVDAPDKDSVALKDSIKIIFTAEDPDNDSLLDTPEIEIIPLCGVFHVERTDTGAFTGTWQLTWSTETGGCVVDTYYIVMQVEDKYGATGEDTTQMIIWKPNHPPQMIVPDTVYGYTDTLPNYTDTVVFTFSAVDPDSDVIEPFHFAKPSCLDTLSVIQTYGMGTFEGVWEVTLQINTCDIGDYPFQIAMKDERTESPGDPNDPGWDTVTTIIHLDIKPSSPPVLDAPDETLWVWIDYELDFSFYAADPDSHKLLDSVSISVEPSCGDTCEYWVNRLWGQGDPGHQSGEWQVQFNAYKSDSDYYHIILDVTDDHDSTSYDTVVVHVFPRPNYNPEVFAPPTASTQINDTLQFLFTASDPDSNDLLDLASLTLQPDCGTYFAVRQASAYAFFGTWKFIFYTFGCTAGVYNIIIDVEDVRDGVGYDTTSILITDRPDSAPIVVAPHIIQAECGDIINYEFSAVDPDTDIILDIANIIVNPNCGVYFANRTFGNGTYTGIWDLTFKTTDCGPGDYDVYMQVQDVYYKMGYAVTTVHLSPTGVEEEGSDISIDRFALTQNYPNPFNLSTEITFQVPVESKVNLKIYNTRGQLVRSLVDGIMDKGLYNIRWDGMDQYGNEVASGIYFYKLTAGEFASVKKMVLLK